MTLVDSNTWGDFFNGVESPHATRLEEALSREEDVGLLPIIVTEVLQGFRTDRGFRQAEATLTGLPMFVPDLDRHVRAAALYRRLRAEGVTVRGAVDCIIAQTCLDLDLQLLSPDRDFEHIAEHTALKLWRP